MSSTAERRLVLATAAALLGAACAGPPCRSHRDCEQGTYCALAADAVEGSCARDCDELWTCPEGAFCNSLGQCQLSPRPPLLVVDEPAQSVQGEPGQSFTLRGRLRFLGREAILRIERDDHAGCEVFRPLELTLTGALDREFAYPFEVPAIALPDGGGTLRVSAQVQGYHAQVERRLLAGHTCADCPRVELLQPASTALAERSLFTWAAGRVDIADPTAVRWHVEADAGASLELPFTLSGAEQLLPLFVGRNLISLEARNAAGLRRCQRWVDTSVPAGDRLLVALGWDSALADLDLHVIPPGGLYGSADCSPAVSESTRFDGCQVSADASSHGPEWALVPANGAVGVYGIVVVGFSGAAGVLTGAHLRVASHGRLLAAMGPRDLVPARGELWVVGTATFDDQGQPAVFTPADVIVQTPPRRPPEQWPPY